MSELTFEQFREKLLRWSVILPQAAKKALTEAAITVQREAQEAHLTGPRMPRGAGGTTNATLAVGQSRKGHIGGRLRQSIAIDVQVKPGEVSATVGTNVFYGRLHELGIGKMPERPFLRPSLSANHHQIFESLRIRMIESYSKREA